MKEPIQTANAQQPGSMPYSQAIRVGDVIYVAGQGPIDPVTDELVGDTLEHQARRALDNVAAILEAAGAKLSDVVKVTVLLGEGVDFGAFNVIYKEYFTEPYPARTISPSPMGFMVQIDAIAHLT
ncbi:Rid family detoxifying hydrolase [Paenibacillus sp. OV219]|uniref:Rid family detoxifying hydrolase n=1 Tax=Paenibacillus sp. OV219 TaxID=1884377 RepID=UPI0008BEDC1B|nr:Rid family detoxifying hydrolase [Paenibacillus sp. OV219]SEO18507.1 2-iminobutanoate/2-iminopropanoate deaminase [Paenibacillus sp. OV219]